MSNINYPSGILPPPLSGVRFSPVNPQLSSKMESGRVITRRNFTAVPVNFSLRWVMTDKEATAFEDFYHDTLKDGSEWFNLRLLTPQGRGLRKVRFVGIYSGPNRINSGGDGTGYWEYSADMQMFLRPTDRNFSDDGVNP